MRLLALIELNKFMRCIW